MDYYDHIVVGSGAGGSAAAYRLAQAGRRVLLLEKGEKLPDDGTTLEVEHVIRRAAFACREDWLDRHGPARLQEYANLGGKTKWYGAALLRMEPQEFAADPLHFHHGWPIAFEELKPFYEEAERLLEVRTFPIEPELRRVVDSIKRQDPNWQDHLQPLGLAPGIVDNLREASRFDGFALSSGAKSDAENKLLAKISELPHVRIKTGCSVVELLPAKDDPRAIVGVSCSDGSKFRGRTVLLAAGALHSPRILQRHVERYRLRRQLPRADLIGRNYKCHIASLILAARHNRWTDRLRKTVWLSHPSFPHSMVQTTGCLDGEILAARLPYYVPAYLSELIGGRAYSFLIMTEDGSHPDNRVISATAESGKPKLDYDFTRLPLALREHRRLRVAFANRLLRQGILPLMKRIAPYSTPHACGTMIAGNDPSTSVVDARGAVRGIRNLYVVDGSALPRQGRVNPALTIYAWGLRVAMLLVQTNEVLQGNLSLV